MPKKCPPGVFCIENFTLFILIIAGILGFILIFRNLKPVQSSNITFKIPNNNSASKKGLFPKPEYSFSNIREDILLNPYAPPLKDDRYINGSGDPRGIPINISTRAVDTSYRQVGILTRNSGNETILPLMGRPLYVNRDKWQYYTMSDKNNMIKLPVSRNGKSCTNEYGCDSLYNGDTIFVEGYNDAFKVTMYDNNIAQYIPFI
jgi:hypothetical protein